MKPNCLQVNHHLWIPFSEIQFSFVRSSGPGGQKVNRTSSQVELTFDVVRSTSLTPAQKDMILHRLRSYVDKRGVLHLSCQTTPSQKRNRDLATERLRVLLEQGLRRQTRRVPTRPTRSSKETRIERKRRRSQTKRTRRPIKTTDW